MSWVYLLMATAGVVMVVPIVLRSLDGLEQSALNGAAAFGLLVAGASGLLVTQFGFGGIITLLVALSLAAGAAALHPELLAALRNREMIPEAG